MIDSIDAVLIEYIFVVMLCTGGQHRAFVCVLHLTVTFVVQGAALTFQAVVEDKLELLIIIRHCRSSLLCVVVGLAAAQRHIAEDEILRQD
jgi:hypothetical protein